MKNNNLLKAIPISLILTFLVVGTVLAGSSFDRGQVEGIPPVGQVNWTAWVNEAKDLSGVIPIEILTEDNTNSDIGVDGGYYSTTTGIIRWRTQVENFSSNRRAVGDKVSIIFGGVGASSGKVWYYQIPGMPLYHAFTWDDSIETTDHGIAPLVSTTQACPAIQNMVVAGDLKTISFSNVASTTYHVYKSTQPSGAPNQASNGRYLYLKSVVTDGTGLGSFSDTEPLESWYVVVKADTTYGIGGCHSEEAAPTALTMGELNVALTPSMTAVNVRWNTFAEIDMVGFDVYRAESEFGPQVKLNTNPVPAMYSGQEGGDYLYVDNTVLPGHTYFYWVEEINTHEWIGPESVSVGYQFYLPFILLN